MSAGIARRTAAVHAGAAAAAFGLTACGLLTPGSGSDATSGGPISTALPAGSATLTIVSSENAGTTKALADAFHA
ncbi:hypothetical protein ABZT27_37470, partial [Streptomyces sp. NPDC005389]